MNPQTIFNNNDIIVELWKHVNVDTMKCLSIVSKNYNLQFKKMSDIDYLSRIYKENNNNLSSFVLKTCKENCKKYNYPTPRFINILCAFIDNNVSETMVTRGNLKRGYARRPRFRGLLEIPWPMG